ncbi:hypothetical protein Bca52824_054163 [Brassica carinata]|uniref:Secreted protein n=1 Tax=Brassica carinata TaxID=52824 RepID=A0A8X7R7Y8_BRACI|nr:hypothetical protein Bca52824_054163 [Brassica carinata]
MGCSSIISVVRLVAAATCVCGCGCGNVLKNSCSFGFFLPAVVRPILHSLEASKQVKAPPSYILCVIAGVTGKKQS